MSNMRAIKLRIRSVESTRQITRSMKMMAASKLRQVQQKSGLFRGYADETARLLSAVAASDKKINNPYLTERETKRICYVLFVGNRGLCGAYNTDLLRHLADCADKSEQEKTLVVCGRWGREYISALGIEVDRCFDNISDTPTAAEAEEISSYLKEIYLSGRADRIVLVYQHYVSALKQVSTDVTLLPAEAEKTEKQREYIFEPDGTAVLDTLCELYISSRVYSALLDAKTSEHTARMTAMTSATDNTDELISKLTLELNHARQSAITTEISEIVGGAAGLKEEC